MSGDYADSSTVGRSVDLKRYGAEHSQGQQAVDVFAFRPNNYAASLSTGLRSAARWRACHKSRWAWSFNQ